MSNSFKNLQNRLQQLKKELEPDEPKSRSEAVGTCNTYLNLVNESYLSRKYF